MQLEQEGKLSVPKNSLKLSKRERKKQFQTYLTNFYYDNLIKEGKSLPSFFKYEECYPYYFGLKSVYNRDFPPNLGLKMDESRYYNKSSQSFWKTLLINRFGNNELNYSD